MPHLHAYTQGDRVRVIDGPFAGHDATIRVVDGDRLTLDVAAARLTVPIAVHPHQITRR